jgi:putative aldouronate transport system permease protein
MGVLEPAASKRTGKIKNNRSSDSVMEIIMYVVAVLFLIILIYPLYFIVIASFSDPSAVAGGKVWLFPRGFTLDGYQERLRHKNIWIGYRNTILYTVVGTAIGLVVNISAAYALSRKDLAGRKILSLFFIFTMFFNGGLIPTFLTIRDFHMYDTFLLGLWIAVGYWNSYFNALIYLKNPNMYPLQLILRNILITNQMQSGMGSGEAAQIALRLANMMRYSVIIIATVPIMCVYPFVQKYFNQGVMIGAVKE